MRERSYLWRNSQPASPFLQSALQSEKRKTVLSFCYITQNLELSSHNLSIASIPYLSQCLQTIERSLFEWRNWQFVPLVQFPFRKYLQMPVESAATRSESFSSRRTKPGSNEKLYPSSVKLIVCSILEPMTSIGLCPTKNHPKYRPEFCWCFFGGSQTFHNPRAGHNFAMWVTLCNEGLCVYSCKKRIYLKSVTPRMRKWIKLLRVIRLKISMLHVVWIIFCFN